MSIRPNGYWRKDGTYVAYYPYLYCDCEERRGPLACHTSACEIPPKRPNRSRRNYRAAYERDGFRCRYCGATEPLSIDHVVPVVQGGSDDLANIVVACMPCNLRKSGRTPEQAGMRLSPLEVRP